MASKTKSQSIGEQPSTSQDPLKGMTPKQISEYQEAFHLFDTDGDGTITIDEIQKVLRSLGRHTTNEEIQGMLSGVDVDRSGTIEFREFIIVMQEMKAQEDTEEDLVDVFRVLDQDGDGLITKSDLREVVVRIGSDLTNQEIEEMIREADKTGDGHVDFEEFSKIILSRY